MISLQEDREVEGLSEDEGRLLRILNDCLSMGRSRYSTFREEQNEKTNRTNEELEVEVNKLIEDYDHMKQENLELANNLDLEQRLKEELLIEVDERDKIIRNLSAKKLGLEKKVGSQENRSVASGLMREEDMKRVEHEAQKYLERSLLLKEQLKVS